MACGPKYMVCVMVSSVWGMLFLGFLGVFFIIHAGILIEDVAKPKIELREYVLNSTLGGTAAWVKQIEKNMDQTAYNCWIAAGMYVFTFVLAFVRFQFVKQRL